jgi:hypothetical protein
MYVEIVLSGCCKTSSGVAYIIMTIHICCKCFKCFSYIRRMLQVFCLDVAYVTVGIHICCKCMFQMFRLCCSKYFMLQVLSLAGVRSE